MTLEKPNPRIDSSDPINETGEIKDSQTIVRSQPKHGRNQIVKITNGKETKEIKYKKAIAFLETGEWRLLK